MEIKENVLLAQFTTLHVGGPARFFCEAKDEKEIAEALEFAREENLPVFALGGGSNILVSDKGFDGIVIRIMNYELGITNNNISCGAGMLLSKIVNESVKFGLTGMEWAAGIPGTVGGAIRGNAGALGSCMAEAVENVRLIDAEKIDSKEKEELGIRNYESGGCEFRYRDSIFKHNPDLIIISAILKLKKGEREASEKKVREIIKQRKSAQPFDFPSSGSFFKNPKSDSEKLMRELERDTGKKATGGVVPAGYLIERAGLRGKKIGGAMVSQNHGNFLVNAGNAKAEDFIILIALVKTKIRNKFGIQLQEEVQYVGF
ncbi:MAG: UDP-N-acetylmuramate dehydrogenase [Parcubacteria group bacterium]|jgi:UDP-N-acetylmuramate dehydrogenase